MIYTSEAPPTIDDFVDGFHGFGLIILRGTLTTSHRL